MKVCVSGSRSFEYLTWEEVWGHVVVAVTDWAARHDCGTDSIDLVIHGGARGIDTLAGEGAKQMGIPVQVYPAEWNLYGKGAGHLRNIKMAMDADLVVAIWDGKSRGTKNMIDFCHTCKRELFIVRV